MLCLSRSNPLSQLGQQKGEKTRLLLSGAIEKRTFWTCWTCHRFDESWNQRLATRNAQDMIIMIYFFLIVNTEPNTKVFELLFIGESSVRLRCGHAKIQQYSQNSTQVPMVIVDIEVVIQIIYVCLSALPLVTRGHCDF